MSEPTAAEAHREPPPATRYYVVWAALLVGTVLTFLLSRVHLPSPFHLLVAIAIACAKSTLVVLFFMHLWDHGGANRLVFVTSVFFVVLLIFLVVLDNASRFVLANPGRGDTAALVPPGPDLITPRGATPSRRVDMPDPGKDLKGPPAPPEP
ncbi:MAG TPA: cytochrome C oxidase subunit IV family protein [Anaeromyxobacteraceae bacterium]|nr:cytochrome C oxidase subunit IV family protein [Anaeromyxobacteraceae bacterium]